MTEHEHAHHDHHSTHHSDPHIGPQKNFVQKIGQTIWDNRAIIVLLIAIFLIAFGIRGHLLRYEYLFEFDAFYHARLVQDIVTQGFVSNPDPLAYYQDGGSIPQATSLYHITSAILYKLVSLDQPFNKDLFMWTIQFFPVVFGSLIAILLYFLGKEVFNNKKIGIIMAFVGAVTPAFAYRTMAGAQGDNAFGFLWMILGFIFFVRAVKTNSLDKKDLINTALAGIMFGAMALSWNMYPLIPLIVILYSFFALVMVASKDNSHNENLLKNHASILFIKILIAMAIFHIMATLYGLDWIGSTFVYLTGITHIDPYLIAILTGIAILITLAVSVLFISKLDKENKQLFITLSIMGLYIGFIVLMFVFISQPDIFYSGSGRTSLASMVGEESVGNQFFGTKYNALIVFPFFALVLLPISLWLYKREDSHTSILFFFWIIITLFMAWYKLKFTFVFGLAIAPAAAIVAFVLLEGLKKYNIEKGIETKIILGALFFLIVLGVGASARFFPDYVPYVDEHPEWQEAQQWIVANTPTDAKLFNWWDQGHILAFTTERKISTDNRNYSAKANEEMAEFVTSNDTNRAYTIASKEIGADYVVLDSSMFYSAPTFEYYVADKVDSKLTQKYASGTIRVLNCTGADTNSATISCDGSAVPRAQWNSLASKWKAVPDDFENGSTPIFYYRTTDQLLIMNDAMNKTNLVKVWTNSDETNNYYEQAYSKNGILILKIKK